MIEVDGKPVKRWSAPIATVVPYALLEPGTHTLLIVRDVPVPPQVSARSRVSVNVEVGKRYWLVSKNDIPVLIEEKEEPYEPAQPISGKNAVLETHEARRLWGWPPR